jgi:DNA-directed RNA polymerase subunit beta
MTQAATYRTGKEPIIRKNFSRIPKIIDIPYLLEIQTSFYERFLQRNVAPRKRGLHGLEEVFRSIFPIEDFNGTASLEFHGYELGIWECRCGEYLELGGPGINCPTCKKDLTYKESFPQEECIKRGLTYADPLKIKVQLIVKDKDEETGEVSVREVKEQKIYLGEIPLMTETGTFIINGTERVAVSQLHRSPGAFFTSEKGKGAQSGSTTYSARLIPYRGSWLDFEFDVKDILHARIDRRRKFPATILLKALGYQADELLSHFYKFAEIKYNIDVDEFTVALSKDILALGLKASKEIKDPKSGVIIAKAGRKLNRRMLKQFSTAGQDNFLLSDEDLVGRYIAEDVVDEETGEILIEINSAITPEIMALIRERRIESFPVLVIEEGSRDTAVRDTLTLDKVDTTEDALKEIYKRMRPGDPPTPESAKAL